MTIETVVSLTTEPTEETEELEVTEYGYYHQIGGILDKEIFDQAFAALGTVPKAALNNPDNEWWRQGIHQCTRRQVSNYAERARISLSPEQTFLYCYMRQQVNPNRAPVKKPVPVTKPWSVDDQPLLAEVLLMTGDTDNLHKFKAAYPVIFPPK